MEVQVAQLTPVLMEMSVTVETDRVKKELEKAFAELQKKARVRGFRPGKAPREVLSHLYGGSVTSDVCSRLVDQTLTQALAEKNVQPLSRPTVEVQSASATAPLQYKARFEVRPEIGELRWEGLQAEKPTVTVDDARVDEALTALRKAHSTLIEPASPRPARAGDVVTFDFTAEGDGKELDSGTGSTAELGEKRVMKELDEALTGMSAGEEKDVPVTFAAHHPNPSVRGKHAVFHLKLVEVKERKVPELDDEFAKDVGQESLEALKVDTRAKVEKELNEQAEQELVTSLVASLCRENPIAAPPSLVQQQAQMTLSELQQSARRAGRRVELTQELQRQLTVDSEVKVRAGLLMAEVARRNDIVVGEQDFENAIVELAAESGKNVARVRAEYRDPTRRQMLTAMVMEDRVLDLLLSKANVRVLDPADASAPSAGPAAEGESPGATTATITDAADAEPPT